MGLSKSKEFVQKYGAILFVVIFVAFFAGYCFFAGQYGLIVPIHDNLEDRIPFYKVLKDNHAFFSHFTDMPLLGGVDRMFLPHEMKLMSVIFMIFPYYTAYVLNYFVGIILSVIGFVLIGEKKWSDKWDEVRNVVILVGFMYGVLPVQPKNIIISTSLPLLYYFLYELYTNNNKKMYIFLFLYPFLSELYYPGVFIIGFIGVFWLIDSIKEKKINWTFIFSAVFLSLGYVVSEYRFIYLMLFSKVDTIKSILKAEEIVIPTLKEFVLRFWEELRDGKIYAGGNACKYICLPVIIISFLVINIKDFIKNKKIRIWSEYNAFFLAIIVSCLIMTLSDLTILNLLSELLGIRLSIMFVVALIPFFVSYLFLQTMVLISGREKIRWLAIALSICAIFSFLFSTCSNNTFRLNFESMKMKFLGQESTYVSFGQFYSEDLFNEIKEDLNITKDDYCVAYGYHPAVLYCNGISTIDGYLSYMPLDYHYKFREVIAPSLDESDYYRDYYDGWGGRAYVFKDDVSYNDFNKNQEEHADLLINKDAFLALGGRYILSRVVIDNADELGLLFKGDYDNDRSLYKIFVYEAKK